MLLITIACAIMDISCTTATKVKSQKSINFVNDATTGINTYHANLIARIYPPAVVNNSSKVTENFDHDNFIEVKSTVFGESGKKMKLMTIMKSPEFDTEIEIMLIFDGTWLWVQNKTTENPQIGAIKAKYVAMKIHIPSVSPDPVNEPFNTFFGISGTGLYRDQDLPGTFVEIIKNYDLKNNTSINNSKKLIYEGNRKIDQTVSELEGANKELRELMEKLSKYCKLWVSKETGLITAYSTGQSEERPAILTNIEYLSVNEKLPEGTFKYNPPDGVVVKDITSTILEKKKIIEEKRNN